jgi:hypothetical protein
MNRARTPTTTESLMRWLAAWLAVAVCVQACAAGAAFLRGVNHRHNPLGVDARAMLLVRHAGDPQPARDAHQRAHANGEAHQHALDDASVLGADAHAAALAAFVGAPAPHAVTALPIGSNGLRHVQAAAGLWSPTARTLAPPRHPPRA